jgi:hypothetical protein
MAMLGVSKPFQLPASLPVSELRRLVLAAFEIQGQFVRLFFLGRALQDHVTLGQAGITEGTTLLALVVAAQVAAGASGQPTGASDQLPPYLRRINVPHVDEVSL